MTKWVPPAIAGAVLAGAALIFLVFQPLGEADQYASVGSFIVSILAFAFAAHTHRSGQTRRPDPRRTAGTSAFIGNDSVQTGAGSRMVDRRARAPRQPRSHTDAPPVVDQLFMD